MRMMVEEGCAMMVCTDTRLDKAGIKRFRKHAQGFGPYQVIGEQALRGEGGGLCAGVLIIYRTDDLYVGEGMHTTIIPGRALAAQFVALADESEFDLMALYMECRGKTGAKGDWETIADWATARNGTIITGDLNASIAEGDERRTPSDIILRELVEEGNLMRIGTGGTTYGSAGTELDYWLTTPDMAVRWEGEGTREGVSDHRAVVALYTTDMESGKYGKEGLARMPLGTVGEEQWAEYEKEVGRHVAEAVKKVDKASFEEETLRWAAILKAIQEGTKEAIRTVMEWTDKGETITAVKPRRKREGVRKILGDIEWWEMLRRETSEPWKNEDEIREASKGICNGGMGQGQQRSS